MRVHEEAGAVVLAAVAIGLAAAEDRADGPIVQRRAAGADKQLWRYAEKRSTASRGGKEDGRAEVATEGGAEAGAPE